MTHLGARYGQLMQMSYVTRDMDLAVAHAETELGITGIVRSQADIEVMSYGQKRQLAVKSAIANIGEAGAIRQFEIIQPVSGAIEVYTDDIDLSAHILAFHHIGVAVPGPYCEWEALLETLAESGDELAFLFPAEPTADAKLSFCYVDTRKRLGHFTEYLWVSPDLAGLPVAPWLQKS